MELKLNDKIDVTQDLIDIVTNYDNAQNKISEVEQEKTELLKQLEQEKIKNAQLFAVVINGKGKEDITPIDFSKINI